MEIFKPITGFILVFGVIFFWIFQTYHNIKADEDALTKKLDSIELKINEIQSEISFFTIDDLNDGSHKK